MIIKNHEFVHCFVEQPLLMKTHPAVIYLSDRSLSAAAVVDDYCITTPIIIIEWILGLFGLISVFLDYLGII